MFPILSVGVIVLVLVRWWCLCSVFSCLTFINIGSSGGYAYACVRTGRYTVVGSAKGELEGNCMWNGVGWEVE